MTSGRPLLFSFRRVLSHEGAKFSDIFICLLKATLQTIKKPAVSKDTHAKSRRANARFGAVVRDLFNEAFVFHGSLSGQLSTICQGQLANGL